MKNQIVPKSEHDIGWMQTEYGMPTILITLKDGSFVDDVHMVEHWKYCLGRPWIETAVEYHVFSNNVPNIKYGFICEYRAVVCDDLEVGLFGFGDSPNQAMADCQRRLLEYTRRDASDNITDPDQAKRDMINDIARMMCSSIGYCPQVEQNCLNCTCNGRCIYQELASQIKGYYPQSKIDELLDLVDGYQSTIKFLKETNETIGREVDQYKQYYFDHEKDRSIAEAERIIAEKIFVSIFIFEGEIIHGESNDS